MNWFRRIPPLTLHTLVLIACCFVSNAVADEFPTEPAKINTDDAPPVVPGAAELEFTYAFTNASHAYSADGNRKSRGRLREHNYEWKIAAGLVDRMELNASIGYADLLDKDNEGGVHGHGWTDIEIGSKILVFDSEEHEIYFTYAPSFVIPSGRDNRIDRLAPGAPYASFGQRLIYSQNWGRWSVSTDAGYGLPFAGSRSGFRGTADFNGGVGYQVWSWFQPEAEINFAHDFYSGVGDTNTLAVTAGAVLPLHERLRMSTGVQQVVAGSRTDQTTTFTLIATFFI